MGDLVNYGAIQQDMKGRWRGLKVRDVCYGYELGMWARGIGYRCRFGLRMWAGDRV